MPELQLAPYHDNVVFLRGARTRPRYWHLAPRRPPVRDLLRENRAFRGRYMKRTGLPATTQFQDLDYYLVLTGPRSPAGSSRGISRPWCIQAAFLFEAREARAGQVSRGVRSGIASSVVRKQWDAAEIYPQARNPMLRVTPEQVQMLRMFQPVPM
jgi:hypothetical protein